MQTFHEMLNDMLVTVFNNIMRIEEEFLQKGQQHSLSIREVHLIEYVGKGGDDDRSLGEIADYLKIARPSVTVAVRKLAEKGLLEKSGSARDGRVIHVSLTREGRKIFMNHMRFHALMVREIASGLDEEERDTLIRLIGKLDNYFEKSVGAAN